MVHRQNDNFPELLHGNSQLYSDLDNIHSNLESNIIRLIFVKKMGTHTLGVVNIKKFYFNHWFLFSTGTFQYFKVLTTDLCGKWWYWMAKITAEQWTKLRNLLQLRGFVTEKLAENKRCTYRFGPAGTLLKKNIQQTWCVNQ